MATVTNNWEVLRVKEKEIRQTENRKKGWFCREFGLVNSTIQEIWGKKKRFRKP